MEKAELIKNYRKAEKEIEKKEKDFAELENKLARSQEALSQAKDKLTSTEEYQQSSNLTTIKEIESARVAAHQARVDCENHNQVIENLELAVQNSDSALNDLRAELSQQKHLISIKLLDLKADEIKTVASHLFEEYTAIALGINNRPPPFHDHRSVPENLEFINGRAADLRQIQADIFAKL